MKLLNLIGFQDPASPNMEGIIDLHNYVNYYLVLVFIFTFWIFVNILYYFNYIIQYPTNINQLKFRDYVVAGNKIVHGTTIEFIWTTIPCFILMFIAVQSFALLYSIDEVIDPSLTLKAIGHQWYWSYEYSDYVDYNEKDDLNTVSFDSYMLADEALEIGQFRLLEVDNQVVLPTYTHIRVLVTANDVLHSWAVPSLGLKVDAVPGRLNQLSVYINREGVFYGQCSELCGVNHGFMPIAVKATSLDNYINWIENK